MTPPKCGANTRSGGKCGRPAGWGTDHPGYGTCKLHLGSTTNHQTAAEREIATAAVEVYGLPREIDPHTALLEELWRTAGHVAWLRLKIAALEEHELHGPVGGGENSIPREVPHVWVVMYQEERKHLANVARDCIRAGIEERRVQLAEEQGRLLARVIRGVLDDLGVSDRPEVPGVVRKHLSMVDSG